MATPTGKNVNTHFDFGSDSEEDYQEVLDRVDEMQETLEALRQEESQEFF